MTNLDGLLRASDTALLVIDMQNAFCHPSGGFAQAGRDVSAQSGVVPTVVKLVRASRAAGLPIIWTIQENLSADDRASLSRRIPLVFGRPDAGEPEAWCIRGTWDADLCDDLREEVRSEDHVVRKHRMSAFYSTTLDSLLRMLQIQCLVVTGVNTEKCVESTVREAFFRDYDVVVVADAVATTDRSFHDDSLRKIDLYFGAVLPAETVLIELSALASGPFDEIHSTSHSQG